MSKDYGTNKTEKPFILTTRLCNSEGSGITVEFRLPKFNYGKGKNIKYLYGRKVG